MRRYIRENNGRFRRASWGRDFGLEAPVCANCRGFNPIRVGESLPTICIQCGEPFKELGSNVSRIGNETDSGGNS